MVLDGYRKKLTTVFLSLFILLIMITLRGYGAETVQLKPIKLKVISLPFISYAPFYVAEAEGYFAEQGLQIEFVNMTDAMRALPALINGDIDVWSDIIYPGCFNSMLRGAKIRIVADKGHISTTGCNYSAFIARRILIEEGKLSNLSNLKGMRVGNTQGAVLPEYELEKLLDKAKLTMSDIQILFIPLPAKIEAFERGRIDISLASEPWITRYLESGFAAVWMPVQEIVPNLQHAILLYGPTLLEKNPDAGKRFMVAYLKGIRQFNQGKTDKNLKILSKFADLDVDLLKKTCWPALRNNGQIDINSVLDFQKWAVKKGLLDKTVTPSQFWDPSFIDYANKVLNTL
jgi:ABC-type nitrate/sulfonate/bicarbonate transport system substrate-binding protein